MDKAKIKEDTRKVVDDAKKLTQETGLGIKKVASKVEDGFAGSQKLQFLIEKTTIEIESGSIGSVKVTRNGTELLGMHLTFKVTPGCNLKVSGGDFLPGKNESMIMIEAPFGASNGVVDVVGDGTDQQINVVVKSKI
jgi:hypothetical protein